MHSMKDAEAQTDGRLTEVWRTLDVKLDDERVPDLQCVRAMLARPASSSAGGVPTVIEAACIDSVRLNQGVTVRIDTGSPGSLCGPEWSRQMAAASEKHGFEPHYERWCHPMTFRGVGAGT